MAQRIIKAIFYRPGPPGPPGNLPGLYYTAEEIDEFLGDYALTTALDALLPKADVLNEPDMATGATDKPPSQASVKTYVGGKLIDEDDFASNSDEHAPTQQSTKEYVDAGLATKRDDTLSPTVFLAPDGSRDRRGTITPSPTGAITTTAGPYQDAWVWASGDVGHIRVSHRYLNPLQGAVLMRARMDDAASGFNYLWILGALLSSGTDALALMVNAAGTPRFRATTGTGNDTFIAWGSALPTGTWVTLYVEWDDTHIGLSVDGGTMVTGTRTAPIGAVDTTNEWNIGSYPVPTPRNPFIGAYGPLVAWAAPPPASEVDRITALAEAWTWNTATVDEAAALGIDAILPSGGSWYQVLTRDPATLAPLWTDPPGIAIPLSVVPLDGDLSGYDRDGTLTATGDGVQWIEVTT